MFRNNNYNMYRFLIIGSNRMVNVCQCSVSCHLVNYPSICLQLTTKHCTSDGLAWGLCLSIILNKLFLSSSEEE